MDYIGKTNGLTGAAPLGTGVGQIRRPELSSIPIMDDSVSLGANMSFSNGSPVGQSPMAMFGLQNAVSSGEAQNIAAPAEPATASIASVPIAEESGSVKSKSQIDAIPFAEPALDPQDDDEARYIPGKKSKLVHTKNTVKNLKTLTYLIEMGVNVWLEGPTGAGKTALIKYLASDEMGGYPLRRLNLNDMSDIEEIIGGYKPSDGNPLMSISDVTDWPAFLTGLQNPDTKQKQQIWKLLDEDAREYLMGIDSKKDPNLLTKNRVVKCMNRCLKAKNFYDPNVFDKNAMDPITRETIEKGIDMNKMPRDERRNFNRHLFESIFTDDVVKLDKKMGRPEWVNGIVIDAMLNGHWLLLDEVNLAEPGVLERLNPLMEGDRQMVLTERNGEVVDADDDFRVFCTSNPVTYSGRKEMSDAMNNRLKKVQIRSHEPEELCEIIGAKGKDFAPETLLQMTKFHAAIADMANHSLLGKVDGPFPYTIRDINKWIDRINYFKAKEPNTPLPQIIWREAEHVYKDRCSQAADKEKVDKALALEFGEKNRPVEPAEKKIVRTGNMVKIGGVELPVNQEGGPFVPKTKLTDVDSCVDTLEKMAKCIAMEEPILLIGNTAAGKTAKAKYLANLTGNNCRRYNMSMQSDPIEFIGGPKPTGRPGEYKWVDGIIVDAMKKGYWVILDEYALADPAIAERLNPLMEGDRTLVLSEHGNEVIEAHPNFRIIATTNPSTYEGRHDLSLAARNRFTEIWDNGISDPQELATVMNDFLKVPQDATLKEKVARKMVDLQESIQEKIQNKELAAKQRTRFVYTIRNLERFSQFINKYAPVFEQKEGTEKGLEHAFVDGAEVLYGTDFVDDKDQDFIREFATQLFNSNSAQPQQPAQP